MNKKIILVTWGLWYIGSHWVVAFEEAWYKTVIVDNLCNSSLDSLNWIENILWYSPDFYELDIRDLNSLEKIFERYDFDWVLHFAWLKAVWESCKYPLKYFDNNLLWSINLFEMMEKYRVKNIVFSSSATVYNSNNKIPFVEWQKTWNCLNPYWTTKFLTEEILRDLSKFSNFKVINLRYFNPIWAHKSSYIWENPDWRPNNLLPFIMKVATWELKELKIFWNDYDTIDGTWVRDYIDVVDLIEWHLKAYKLLGNLDVKWYIEDINLWVGKWTSVLEMLRVSEKICWKKINFVFSSRRDWDLPEFYCDPSKAKKLLNWEAKTKLEDSVENSWKFYNK